MSVLILDVETSTKNKGNPFTKDNKLCQVGLQTQLDQFHVFDIEYSDTPYGSCLKEIQKKIDAAELLVGFNIKFDLHWLTRYNSTFTKKRIWDCQVAHFIINNQQARFPSLNDVAEYYNLGVKEDVVAAMWKEGIDTPDIPWDILESYLVQDLKLTYQIYLKQKEYFNTNPAKYRLFFLQMLDLVVLQETEWNGMRFNKELSLVLSNETLVRISRIKSKYNFSAPVSFTSGDNVSALLYGGIIKEKYRETYPFVYKDERVVNKERWSIKEHRMPQLVKPLPKSEMAKEGFYATDKVTLAQLTHKRISKETKALIEDIIEYGDLEHLNGTYFEGLPKQMEKHGEEEYIHGQFNQVVAVTGRLSSSQPNLQNRDKRIDNCFISRFV